MNHEKEQRIHRKREAIGYGSELDFLYYCYLSYRPRIRPRIRLDGQKFHIMFVERYTIHKQIALAIYEFAINMEVFPNTIVMNKEKFQQFAGDFILPQYVDERIESIKKGRPLLINGMSIKIVETDEFRVELNSKICHK